jgi:hypothetical protein
LDWFWRGWFYSTDNVDISLDDVKWFQLNTHNPFIEEPLAEYKEKAKDQFIGDTRNLSSIKETVNETDGNIDDFYAKRNKYEVDALDIEEFKTFNTTLSAEDSILLNSNKQFYELTFSNVGGLVMPIVLEIIYADNTIEVKRFPAEIWRQYEEQVTKVLILDKEVISFRLDPFLETADTDVDNNSWPRREEPSRFELFQMQKSGENLMQRQKRVEELNKN